MISSQELSQRVALLKRFRELLKAQRDRFRSYLNALDKQQEVIQSGNADDMLRHVELNEKILNDIVSIQKVIDPLDEMYSSLRDTGSSDDEVINLKASLDSLQSEVVCRFNENRELLASRMTELRSEINSMKNSPYNRRKSPFASTAPSQVDIRG